MKRINVTQPSMPVYEEYINEIKELWDNKWITNNGNKYLKLENMLKKYLNNDNLSLFTNGHLALESAIEALNLEGDIITTPFTFVSTAHAIARKGLKPVFCDINEEDFTLDVTKIESLITSNTSAIIPVHVYGNVCDYKTIDKIAKKYNLKVIYDAAHAFGVEKNNINVANMGDISMFSFHATKVFNTIEGGALTYNDGKMREKFDFIKNFGIKNEENVEYIGGNLKMNEFQAAMGICNLRHIDEEIEKRKKIDQYYRSYLSNIKGIRLNKIDKNVKHNYSYFPIVIDGYKYSRDELYDRLVMKNIYSRKYFYPLINQHKIYNYQCNETLTAKHISECILTLPLYSDMNEEDVKTICESIIY